MYTVSVRDHVMIAHSFKGAVFGPAQRLHGATYVVDVEFRRPTLDNNGLVIDIGLASAALAEVLEELNYRNLDEDPSLADRNTTTEVLAEVIFSRLFKKVSEGDLGASASGLTAISVTLHESHVAWARYEGALLNG